MITRELALQLLNEGYKEGPPAMVHGTSIEAVAMMFDKGKLPSSRVRGGSDHTSNNGWLYFRPRKKSFADHKLQKGISLDLDGNILEDSVATYGAFAQGQAYLNEMLGAGSLLSVGDIQTLYCLDEKAVNKKVLDEIRKVREIGHRRILNELSLRKGVCLGIKPSALSDLVLEHGQDDPGLEVMAYLPDGLDIKYVQYIFPFGETEERKLDLLARSCN